jgi:hypothetical protein
VDYLTQQKKTIDEKVSTQKYAYIAKRKTQFDNTESELQSLNTFLESSVFDAKNHAMNLFRLAGFDKNVIFSKLFSIVSDLVTID